MLNFLKGLDNDLQQALIIQLRDLWSHTSTAIEGNTLTLGETAFVLEEGLTISGKPL
ncbi:MAG: Fic family protein, partial [Gammaproteobacteria bacterium]